METMYVIQYEYNPKQIRVMLCWLVLQYEIATKPFTVGHIRFFVANGGILKHKTRLCHTFVTWYLEIKEEIIYLREVGVFRAATFIIINP